MNNHIFNKLSICFVLVGLFYMLPLKAEEISVQAQLSQGEGYVGESIIYQIKVTGSDSPEQPDMSAFKDFKVTYMGGQNTNQSFQMTINGQTTRHENKGFVFQYQLVARRAGTLSIPNVTLRVNGLEYQTGSTTVFIKEPQEADDYKLRLWLSKKSAYIGEQITLTMTLYLNANIQSLIFVAPILNDERFHFIELEPSGSAQDDDRAYVQVNDQKVLMKIGKGKLNGRSFQTLVYSMVMIPRVSGSLNLEKMTASFEGVSGYRNVRDFFGRAVRQEEFSKFVIPSNQPQLKAMELPRDNRPPGFSGLIGEYKVKAEAYPLEVKVGDPITYTVKLSGRQFMQYDDLPDLNEFIQFEENFKIPKDRAPGKVKGGEKVFLHTIRASNKDVQEIPSLEVPFFNTRTGKYEKAVAAAIPLKVDPTGTLTYLDLEGEDPEELKKGVESWKEGIAYNYTGSRVFQNQNAGLSGLTHPLMLLLIIILPLAYLVLLFLFKIRPVLEANRNPVKIAIQKATSLLTEMDSGELSILDKYNLILDQLREYFGAKFNKKAAALTFSDIKELLIEKKASEGIVDEIKSVYDTCEAARYAKQSGSELEELKNKVLQLIQDLERSLS